MENNNTLPIYIFDIIPASLRTNKLENLKKWSGLTMESGMNVVLIDGQQVLKMNVVMYGMDQLSQLQKEREAAFYTFIFNKATTSNLNEELYFTKFLVNQFTTFPIAKGYPIISKKCKQPRCYFYVNVEQARDLDHGFLRFLNRQDKGIRCTCGNLMIDIQEFVYDAPLAGFLQLKLSQLDYSVLKTIQITKNHEVYLENKGPFQEAFNCARLSAITSVGNSFRSEKQEKDQVQVIKQSKTLEVNTCSIMSQIQYRICDLHMFKGQYKPSQENWKDNVKQKNILPLVSVKSARPFVYLYKQISQEHKLVTIPLQVKAELGEKYLEYYDYDLLTYYYLNTNGVLFYCDFRFMYNFTTNTYQLAQYCTIKGLPQMNSLIKDHSKLIIKNGKIYFFCAIIEKPQFIHVFKGLLPQQAQKDSRPVIMQSILKDKAYYRRGFSVTWIRAGLLIKQECIIIFGGVIEKMKNFKLLQIMVLSPQQEKYLYHMVSVNEEDFNKVSLLFANVSIFASKLMMIGGYESVSQKYNKNILFLPLKEGTRVTVQPIKDSGKEEGDKAAVEAVHISEGTLIYGRLGKQIKPTILKLRTLRGGVQIQNIKLT